MDITDNKRAMSKLRTYCEDCKLTLSRKEMAQITVDSLYEGMDFSSNITRSVNSSVISLFVCCCGNRIIMSVRLKCTFFAIP